jgi:hypothetical protein
VNSAGAPFRARLGRADRRFHLHRIAEHPLQVLYLGAPIEGGGSGNDVCVKRCVPAEYSQNDGVLWDLQH